MTLNTFNDSNALITFHYIKILKWCTQLKKVRILPPHRSLPTSGILGLLGEMTQGRPRWLTTYHATFYLASLHFTDNTDSSWKQVDGNRVGESVHGLIWFTINTWTSPQRSRTIDETMVSFWGTRSPIRQIREGQATSSGTGTFVAESSVNWETGNPQSQRNHQLLRRRDVRLCFT